MKKKRQMRRSHKEWLEIIEEQKRSKQSPKEFCKRKGLQHGNFLYHARPASQAAAALKDASSAQATTTETKPKPTEAKNGSIYLKPEGWSGHIEVRQGFDPDCLQKLLQTVEKL